MIIAKSEHHTSFPAAKGLPLSARRCRRKFLTYYPGGFQDPDYINLERGYKEAAHAKWVEQLNPAEFRSLLKKGRYHEIADAAVRIESRTNLLFSFEKMAIRDAVKSREGARLFAQGLYDFLHGPGSGEKKFARWVEIVGRLPRKQTRVLTWPVATVFGFLAQPDWHFFLKPTVTRLAAARYGYEFKYHSRPEWDTYADALDFAETVRRDMKDLKPKDMIDLQGFIWVQGSDEYPD
jgi:hypothetical protein